MNAARCRLAFSAPKKRTDTKETSLKVKQGYPLVSRWLCDGGSLPFDSVARAQFRSHTSTLLLARTARMSTNSGAGP